MRISIIFLLFFSFVSPTTAQYGYANQWLFGAELTKGTLLDFSMSPVQIDTNFQKNMEFEGASAVMCDSLGNLLFYTNGCFVANAQGQMLKNGDGFGLSYLSSFCNTGGGPMPQSIIALPKPFTNNKFVLFYQNIEPVYDSVYFPIAPTHLYYAEIDMDAEQGKGAVTSKHISVINDTLSRGQVTAQRHANGADWWIICPEKLSNCYWTILLTNEGVDTVFKQCIGPSWDDNDGVQPCFSPSGKYFSLGNDTNGLLLFDFDQSNGLLTHSKQISLAADTFSWHFSGLAFSPNSRFLYLTSGRKLWQYDMLATDIAQSRELIGVRTTLPGVPTTALLSMLLAPDGKIYIAGMTSFNHLHVINQPNCKGLACQFEQYAVDLKIQSVFTMLNAPNYIPWPQDTSVQCISSVPALDDQDIGLTIAPNPAVDYITLKVPVSAAAFRARIFTSTGALVREQVYSHTEAPHMEVADLPSGLYFVQVLSESGQLLGLGKLVK